MEEEGGSQATLRCHRSADQEGQDPGKDVKPELIDVSMEHFSVDGVRPVLLPKDSFGPDQEGLTIMVASEARLTSKQLVRSCGALAILVVGSDLCGFADPIQIPANWKQDHLPW